MVAPESSPSKKIFDLIVTYFCPTVVGKILILYFGLNYSYYPGDGYGYGLFASVAFTLIMLTRFIIKYWNQEEI